MLQPWNSFIKRLPRRQEIIAEMVQKGMFQVQLAHVLRGKVWQVVEDVLFEKEVQGVLRNCRKLAKEAPGQRWPSFARWPKLGARRITAIRKIGSQAGLLPALKEKLGMMISGHPRKRHLKLSFSSASVWPRTLRTSRCLGR